MRTVPVIVGDRAFRRRVAVRKVRAAVRGTRGSSPVFSSLSLRLFACLLLASVAWAMPGSTAVTSVGQHGLYSDASRVLPDCGSPRDCVAAGAEASLTRAPLPPPREHGDEAAPGKRRTHARQSPVDAASATYASHELRVRHAWLAFAVPVASFDDAPTHTFDHPFPDATRSGRLHLRASRGRGPPSRGLRSA